MTPRALLAATFCSSLCVGAAAAVSLATSTKRRFADVEGQMVSDAGLAAAALRSPELYGIVEEYEGLRGAKPDDGLRLAILAAALAKLIGDESSGAMFIGTAAKWCEKTGRLSDCDSENISAAVAKVEKTLGKPSHE